MKSTRPTASHPRIMSVPAAASCVLAILLGAGCGQSGPLFLPAGEPPARADSKAVEVPADDQGEQARARETEAEAGDHEETP